MLGSPAQVDKTNWVSGDPKTRNTYAVVQSGSTLSVTRLDPDFYIWPVQLGIYLLGIHLGWGDDLEFVCCPGFT